MTSATRKFVVMLMVCLAGAVFAHRTSSRTHAEPPNPVLVFVGQESHQTGGKSFIRYRYEVHNSADYPAELFAPAPNLPPCGSNTKASRTWVDMYELNGKRLNGFCALGSPADLKKLWFALEENVIPPSWIYIELNDRQTGAKYKSNVAETTL